MIDPTDVSLAADRIAEHVIRTPLLHSLPLSERHGADIHLKSEHLQRTGSFKVRGSANLVHALDADAASAGVVTASTGNHGIGVATAAASSGIACTIFLPSNASPSKVADIGRLGAETVFVDATDSSVAETAARAHADEVGRAYVSPYNDPLIIAGQGTIGLEILQQAGEADLGTIDAVAVSVGGGGLISGIATWLKEHSPATQVIGASALNDRAMAASVDAGQIITPTFEPTFSDGTAGGLEDGTITFDICERLIDEWIDVTEADIAHAVRNMIDDHHQLIEGAAGVAIAAATTWAASHPGATIVAVTCGANVSSATMTSMLNMSAS